MKSRKEFILDMCKAKKVLHIGCCDTPYCKQFAQHGTLLHFAIQKVAREVWGVDISHEDITYLQKEFGVENLYTGDAEELEKLFSIERFDVVVAGEVIEHVLNPGKMLVSIRSILKEDGMLVLTTVNGLAFRRGLKALIGKETVHHDHNFYFSRKVLTHLLSECGYEVVEIHGYRIPESTFLGAYLADRFSSFFSQWACEGIMCGARPNQQYLIRHEC